MGQNDPDIDEQPPSEPSEKPDITNVPWSSNDAFLGVILLIPLSLIFLGSIYLFGFLLSLIMGIEIPTQLNAIAVGGATFMSGIGLAWALGIKRRGGKLANLGVTDFQLRLDIPLAILGEILIFVGLATYSKILEIVAGMSVPEQPVDALFGSSPWGLILAVVFVSVLAPIGEEVFFRGFVYTAFRRQWGVAVAVVASSGIFAVFHIMPLLYVPMFIIGVILAMLFEYRGSLVPNILLHGLNNFLALLVVYGQTVS